MSKYKLVEVYDGVADTWKPRNAIFFNSSGSVVVVNCVNTQLHDDYNVCHLEVYARWREIQQPVWKPFPDNKSMEHLKNCWFRHKGGTRQFIATSYEPDFDDVFKFDGEWWTIEEMFNLLEVQINGKWQPAGVEEC